MTRYLSRILTVLTVGASFSYDLRLYTTYSIADSICFIVTVLTLFVFVLEILIKVIFKYGYFHFRRPSNVADQSFFRQLRELLIIIFSVGSSLFYIDVVAVLSIVYEVFVIYIF